MIKKKSKKQVQEALEDDSSEDDSSDGEMRDVGDELAEEDDEFDSDEDGLEKILMQPTNESDEEDQQGKNQKGKGDKESKLLNVEFEFCDPKEDDFAMIKALIMQGTAGLMPKIAPDLSELAGDITEQGAVGTTICVDKEVYGFASAIAFNHYQKKAYFANLKEWLVGACPASKKSDLEGAFEEGLAWVVSERLVNMPGQLAPPLLRMLYEDIKWARENVGETGGSADMFDFKYVMFLAPCFAGNERADVEKDLVESDNSDVEDSEEEDEDDNEVGDKGKTPKKGSKTPKESSQSLTEDPLFLHYEDEDLVKKAEIDFPVRLATKVVVEGKAKGAVPQKHRPRQAQVIIMKLPTLNKVITQLEKETALM
mmetsp:Transcript_19906/g.39071  ORF Transcript_19906/g.39071 Transcript_19906/m.39071 type:complete len:369 (+) Transcript_19906:216-1322(+)